MNRYIHIYLRYKCAGCNVNVMRQSACLVLRKSRLIALLPPLHVIERRLVMNQT